MDKNIKILVSYHKPSVLVKSDVFVPIHVGREIADELSKDGHTSNDDYRWLVNNMIGDNTGDNISGLNRRFCELTGIYWAWKNYNEIDNPDYVGFMHYRRFLNFTDKKFCKWGSDLKRFQDLDESFKQNTGLDDETVKKCIAENDIVTVKQWRISWHSKRNVETQYANAEFLHAEDYTLAMNILKSKYPQFAKAADIYNKSLKGYYTNIFIMKKDIFNEYASWLFDILFECERKIPYRNIVEDDRVIGHIAERLFGIYITYLKMTDKNLKLKECERTFVENTDIKKELVPIFKDEVSVVMSADKNYAPYLAVCIKSLIENSSENNNYCIYVLNTDLGLIDINRISNMQTKNCKIKFLNVSPVFQKYNHKLFHICKHFSVATYFRFFIPEIFKNFEKVIYCDCDAVFADDVAKLYSINIGDNLLGAIKDTVAEYTINKSKGNFDYYSNYLNLKEPKDYFQAGMLIMNIPEMNRLDFTKTCIETLKLLDKPLYLDQCVLNTICEGRVYFLHEQWNFMYCMSNFIKDFKKHLPNDLLIRLSEASKTPKYVHFCGFLKPWQLPALGESELFWRYARLTDYYEQIIYENAPSYKTNLLIYSKIDSQKVKFLMRLKRKIYVRSICYDKGKKYITIKLYKFHFRICINENKIYNSKIKMQEK